MTLAEMNSFIDRMNSFAQQEKFTDDDFCEIAELFDHFRSVPGTGDEWTQNREKYLESSKILRDKINVVGKGEYYNWFSFRHIYPTPKSETSPPDSEHTVVAKCCMCGLTTFKDYYGQSRLGGLNSRFFHRTDEFTDSVCNYHDETDEHRCCFRTSGGSVGSEMSSGSRSNYKMVHRKTNCRCFEKQQKGDTRMLSGSYGSYMADDQDYQVVGANVKFVDGASVCDWCINDMIYSGDIVWLTGS
jgi:hypothetical protein